MPELHLATSVDDAVERLADTERAVTPLAGGTWVMRAGLRGEAGSVGYVGLSRLAELRTLEISDSAEVGALITHAQLAAVDVPSRAMDGLVRAAATSGFPAVRNVATVGGNLCSVSFAEADLVPALLAADAGVVLRSATGSEELGVEEFLRRRPIPGALVVAVRVPLQAHRRSGYQRLTVRGGGEYGVASVALSVDLEADGRVAWARLAVGSVEPVARLCEAAADSLVGAPLTPAAAREAGLLAGAETQPRDGTDAPGWYRKAVLPGLVEQVVASIVLERESA